jgi:hypothetical protein
VEQTAHHLHESDAQRLQGRGGGFEPAAEASLRRSKASFVKSEWSSGSIAETQAEYDRVAVSPSDRDSRRTSPPTRRSPPLREPDHAVNCRDIEPLEWWECVRKRPGMYIGGVGRLGLLRLIRELLDCARDVTATEISVGERSVTIQLTCTPPSVTIRSGSGLPFLLEACCRLTVAPDDPPTLGFCEVFDEDATPPAFRTVPQVTSALAIANALASELRVTSLSSGVATRFSFAQGRPTGGSEVLPTERPDGLAIFFASDAEVFGDSLLRFQDVADIARDVASVRRRAVVVTDSSGKLRFECDGAGN